MAAEAAKLRTTLMVYSLLATTLALTVVSVVAAILTAGRAEGTFPLDTAEGVRNVLGAGWVSTTVVLVLGILAMAGEFRHGTITPTLLAAPKRGRVVAAKMATYALVGLVFSALASALTLAVALPWLAAKDVEVSLLDREVGLVVLGLLLGTALYGLLGVSLGSLIRNPAAAVAIALVWSFVIEALLVGLVPEVGRWLPGGAGQALARSSTTEGELLPMWGGGLLLVAYSVLFALVGARFVLRRDIT